MTDTGVDDKGFVTPLDKAKGALAELATLEYDAENPGDRRVAGFLLDIAEVQAAIAQADALESINTLLSSVAMTLAGIATTLMGVPNAQ